MPEVPPTPVLLVDGPQQSAALIDHSPYTVGRSAGCDLYLRHSYVSRKHAEIVFEDGSFFLVDKGSRHGTYVNNRKIERHKLCANDRVEFGMVNGPQLRFGVKAPAPSTSVRDLLSQLQPEASTNTALEKLNWLLEAARKLNDHGGVDQVLSALIETTLALTKVERGFVMLCDPEGEGLKLAAGFNSTGQGLVDDSTISHSAIRQALRSADPFIVTDTLSAESGSQTDSVIAQNIRAIICMPLRSRRNATNGRGEVLGVLYLDSRIRSGNLTKVDNDLLNTIATEAAALVENAQLAVEEEHARRYREELNIAASIQQSLMTVQVPELPFARIATRFDPCKEVGGDFYDVVVNDDRLYVVIADVAGKGVSAALLAHTLQGMVYAQLLAHLPLEEIADALNRYICTKDIGKYATMIVLKLGADGLMEYINCGHIHPLLSHNGNVRRLSASNLPIGLIEEVRFNAHSVQLSPATRVLVVTDGVTEAENAEKDFFGNVRLESAFRKSEGIEDIADSIAGFCREEPSNDDRTMVEIFYR
ncbi:SpoIIE family protein phosphatase [Silvibacterium acidisoli]|uniref:SpoIIE family protein phosphatase n=1 Tax=Acidobacteriaceae bacterium ZG23-2 TaxID=2883246 RepID=UPI00406C8E35